MTGLWHPLDSCLIQKAGTKDVLGMGLENYGSFVHHCRRCDEFKQRSANRSHGVIEL